MGNELNQEKRRAIVVNAEQEKKDIEQESEENEQEEMSDEEMPNEAEIMQELARQQKNERQRVAKETVKKIAKGAVKKIISNPAFWPVVGYILLVLLVALVIFIAIYFIVNPCELARIVGEWWATAVGEGCKLFGK